MNPAIVHRLCLDALRTLAVERFHALELAELRERRAQWFRWFG